MRKENAIKTIEYSIYALVVVIPLIYFPTGLYSFQIIKITFLQAIVEVIFALWLALAIFYKDFRPKTTPLFWAMAIFMAVVSLASLLGVDFKISLWSNEQRALGLVTLWHFAALFLVISSLRERINWHTVWLSTFTSSALVALIGISQKFFATGVRVNPFFGILYQKIPERVSSLFGNPAFMAGYLLFNFFIGLWLISEAVSERGAEGKDDPESGGIFQRRSVRISIFGVGTALMAIAIFLPVLSE